MNFVFVPNDFGYGPTSRALTIAKSLKELSPNVSFVTSGFSEHLIDGGIQLIKIKDLRNIDELKKTFVSLGANAVIVSSMNRFAVIAAKDTGHQVILVDGLFWFWRKRPQEYYLADLEICCVLPWMLDDMRKTHPKKILVASPIETLVGYDSTEQNHILINLGGYLTPYHKSMHDKYLELIGRIVQKLPKDKDIVLASSDYPVDYFNDKFQFGPFVKLLAPSKLQYQELLANASIVLLNGGSNSFLETLIANREFRFLPPSNLSQYSLQKNVVRYLGNDTASIAPFFRLNNYAALEVCEDENSALDVISNLSDKLLAKRDFGSIANMIIFSELDALEKARLSALRTSANESVLAPARISEIIVERF